MKRMVADGEAFGGTQYAICDHPGCDDSFKLHHWGSKAADREGWFLQKNGDCWCPEHIPEWATAWREKKAENERRWGK